MWAILVAAGRGARMGGDLPKQYQLLAGKPIIERSLRALEAAQAVNGIMVVLGQNDEHWDKLKLRCSKPLKTVLGGAERADSVLSGLDALASECGKDDWVMVHDAARPCLDPALVDRLEAALMGHPCGGLLAIPVRDTLKQVREGEVVATLDRAQLWQAQTPQVYRYDLLRQALLQASDKGVQVTDETMAMELAGYHPRIVEGAAGNIKITVPEDMLLAEFLLDRAGMDPLELDL